MTSKLIEYPTARWARELPDHQAVISGNETVTYCELEDRISVCTAWLRLRGVAATDRVVVCGSNSLQWIVVVHALARLGAVHVPIGSRTLKSQADEYRRLYSPKLILTDRSSMYLWDQANSIEDGFVEDTNQSESPLSGEIDSEALHSIVQTSGSEGEPKGVCLSFRNHLSSALGSALNLGVRPDDRWLLNLPMDRIGGLAIVIRAAIYGTTVVVHDRFDASEVWRSIDEQRVTQLSCVTTTLRRVLDAVPGRRCPAQVRTVLVGGGPVPVKLIDSARGRGFPILPTYGLTESSSQIATLSTSAPDSKRHTAGVALPLADIEIRDESDTVVPPGIEGRICIQGPMVSEGYWTSGGQIQCARDHKGWLVTNDVGSLDVDGYLQVFGRIDNVIISGGMKIHVEEIENALMTHDTVAAAAVVAVPDSEWGQRPAAFVELKSGSSCGHDQLLEFVSEQLPGYKVPRDLKIVESLPVLPSGKPDREATRSRYCT